jgi:hypothetical protein
MTKNPKIIDQEVGNLSAYVNSDKWKINLVELFFFIYNIGSPLGKQKRTLFSRTFLSPMGRSKAPWSTNRRTIFSVESFFYFFIYKIKSPVGTQ